MLYKRLSIEMKKDASREYALPAAEEINRRLEDAGISTWSVEDPKADLCEHTARREAEAEISSCDEWISSMLEINIEEIND